MAAELESRRELSSVDGPARRMLEGLYGGGDQDTDARVLTKLVRNYRCHEALLELLPPIPKEGSPSCSGIDSRTSVPVHAVSTLTQS